MEDSIAQIKSFFESVNLASVSGRIKAEAKLKNIVSPSEIKPENLQSLADVSQ